MWCVLECIFLIFLLLLFFFFSSSSDLLYFSHSRNFREDNLSVGNSTLKIIITTTTTRLCELVHTENSFWKGGHTFISDWLWTTCIWHECLFSLPFLSHFCYQTDYKKENSTEVWTIDVQWLIMRINFSFKKNPCNFNIILSFPAWAFWVKWLSLLGDKAKNETKKSNILLKVEFIDDCGYMHACMREARVCVRAWIAHLRVRACHMCACKCVLCLIVPALSFFIVNIIKLAQDFYNFLISWHTYWQFIRMQNKVHDKCAHLRVMTDDCWKSWCTVWATPMFFKEPSLLLSTSGLLWTMFFSR